MKNIEKTSEKYLFPCVALLFFVGVSIAFSYYMFPCEGSSRRFILYGIIFSSFSLPVFWALYNYYRKQILELQLSSKETNRELQANMELLSKVNALLEREIYERGEAQETLKESEETLKKITSSASDAIIMIDSSGSTTFWSPGAEAIFGYKSHEVMNKDIHKLIAHPDFFESYSQAFPVFAASGQGNVIGKTVEVSAVKKDGTVFPVELSLSAVKIKGAWNAVAIVRDITERKRNEDNLRKLSAAVEHTADSVIIANIDGCIEFVNSACLLLKGIKAHDVIGKHIKDINEEPFTKEFFIALQSSVIEGDVYRGVTQNRDINGEIYYMDITVSPVRGSDGKVTHFIVTGRDITYNFVAAEALKHSEEKFRSLVNNIPDVIWTCDSDGKVAFISKNVEDLLGLSPVELQKAGSIYEIGCIHPDDIPRLKAAYCRLFENNKPFSVEVRAISKDGRQLWLMSRSMFAYEKAYKLYADGALTDITEIKLIQDELNKAKDEAERATRAKSEFLSLMSHEFRTPMNAILGFAQLLESDPYDPLTPYQLENTSEILKAGRHLLELIDNVLDLSRIESGRVKLSIEPVDLQSLADDSVSLIKPIADSHNVSIAIDMENSLETAVRADKIRLKQVILNLLSNSLKYSKEGGSILIQGRRTDDMFEVSVLDYGIEMSMENRKYLVNGTDADKKAINALGTGLVIARELISLMGGTMGIESEEGRGSRYFFTIPVSSEFPENKISVDKPDSCDVIFSEKDKSIILCIDDNPSNQKLVYTILSQRHDLELISAYDAPFGIEMAKSYHPDIILLDINMQGMDWLNIVRLLKKDEETTDIAVIAIGANVQTEDMQRYLEAGFVHYLAKPIDVTAFVDTINTVLCSNSIKKTKKHDNASGTGGSKGCYPCTLLYIEDNPASVTLLNRIISRYKNIKFLSAADGLTGVQLAVTHKPDIILTDINLPDISGMEVLKRIRANAETAHTPVIALSGYVDEGDSTVSDRSIFTRFLIKPFNFKEFMGIIDELLVKK